MKLATAANRDVAIGGDIAVGEGVPFAIAATAKTFEALSSMLYSNKPRSIIREICSNAADAHAAARAEGREPPPWQLHLPTIEEPYFGVRDFGTGISPDKIDTIYRVYFLSDKSGSDDFIGALGLGAKTPFAYAQQFSVTSWQDGVRHDYTMMVGGDGLPQVLPVAAVDDDAPVGVEVRMAVKERDFGAFLSNAELALGFFDPDSYEVVGGARFAAWRPDYSTRTEAYSIRVGGRYGGPPSSVVMGGVGYPIDVDQLNGAPVVLGSDGISAVERTSPSLLATRRARRSCLVQHGIDVFVPIGAVEVTLSREELAYKPKTVTAVCAVLDQAVDDLCAGLRDAVAAAPTFWDANVIYFTQRKALASIFKEHVPPATWRGRPVSGGVKLPDDCLWVGFDDDPDQQQHSYGRSRRKRLGQEKRTSLRATPRIVQRVYAGNASPVPRAAITRDMEADGLVSALYVPTGQLDAAIEMAGFAHLVKRCDAIPKPVVVRQPRDKTDWTKVRRWTPSGFANAEVDAAQGGVYVLTARGLLKPHVTSPKWVNYYDIRGTLHCIDVLAGKQPEVYGILTSELEGMQKKGRWIHLDQLIEDLLRRHAARLMPMVGLIEVSAYWSPLHRDLIGRTFAADSVYAAVAAFARRDFAARADKQVDAFRSLLPAYGRAAGLKAEPDKAYQAAINAARATYPLLGWPTYGHTTAATPADAAAYVQLIDDARSGRPPRLRRVRKSKAKSALKVAI